MSIGNKVSDPLDLNYLMFFFITNDASIKFTAIERLFTGGFN